MFTFENWIVIITRICIIFQILLICKCLENNLQAWRCIVLVRYIKHVLLLIILDLHGSEGYVSKYIFSKHIIRQSITSRIAFMHFIRNSFNFKYKEQSIFEQNIKYSIRPD